jgi:hypothetical protein
MTTIGTEFAMNKTGKHFSLNPENLEIKGLKD